MPQAFYRYVRGLSDEVPPGYTPAGLRVYRHLVWLGASQMVDASFPGLRGQLGEPGWRELIEDFVRHSAWTSPFYGDLEHAFREHLAWRQGADGAAAVDVATAHADHLANDLADNLAA